MLEKENGYDIQLILADSHCHIHPPYFEISEFKEIANKSIQKGVTIIINNVVEPDTFEYGLKSLEYPSYYLSVGLQPTIVSKESYDTFLSFFKRNSRDIIAIGEVGLDFHWVKEEEKRGQQKQYFRKLITFAKKENKPLVIHSRAAEREVIAILKEEEAKRVHMHCFDGSEQQIKEIINEGWYISVPTSAVYRKNYQKNLELIPPDFLLFETDSPYHSLEKGKKNDPSSIPILCKKASQLINIDYTELAHKTTENVKKLYGIK